MATHSEYTVTFTNDIISLNILPVHFPEKVTIRNLFEIWKVAKGDFSGVIVLIRVISGFI